MRDIRQVLPAQRYPGWLQSGAGTIYVDAFFGNGYADRSAIAAISAGGAARLLWKSKR